MQAQLKQLDANKWSTIHLKDIVGQSILSYMKNSNKPMVAALFEGEKPVLFVCNKPEDIATYAAKGVSLSVDDMLILLGTEVIPAAVYEVFPDARFEKREVLKKSDPFDMKKTVGNNKEAA